MKKLFALLVVLALALSAVAVAEEAVGSPVPFEITSVTPEGVTAAVKTPEEDELTGQLLDAIVAENDNEKVFGTSGLEDLSKYELVELVGLEIADYDEASNEDVVLNIKFGASFEQGDDLITLLGLIGEADENSRAPVNWESAAFAIEDNGTLTITLTPEQAIAVQNGTAVIAVLKKIAE